MSDILFGKFSGSSKLKQGDRFIQLTPDPDTGAPSSELAPLLPVRELEGAFGVVKGERSGNTLFEASLVEVIPPILSTVLDGLVRDETLDAEALLPLIERSIEKLVRVPEAPPPAPEILCALVIGHRPSARGAVSRDGSLTEFDFNQALAGEIESRVTKSRVRIVLRDNSPDGLSRLPGKINKLRPHFIVSLHCNAFSDPRAGGTETLFFKSSKEGHRIAKIVQRHIVGALGLPDRHTKPRTAVERGGILLKHTVAPAVICEPFFISNDRDLGVATSRQDDLVGAYAAAIDEIADSLRP